jgi:hypothetical protein
MRPTFQIVVVLAVSILTTTSAPGQDWKNGGFETWDDAAALSSDSTLSGEPFDSIAPQLSKAGQTKTSSASIMTQSNDNRVEVREKNYSKNDYLIRFGAGASWLNIVKLDNKVSGNTMLSDFSVSIAPFRGGLEIGTDIIMAEQSFFVVPNLKYFHLKNDWVGSYTELDFPILLSHIDTQYGGGLGIGLMITIMNNLALDLRTSLQMFLVTPQDAEILFGQSPEGEGLRPVLLASIGARMIARF